MKCDRLLQVFRWRLLMARRQHTVALRKDLVVGTKLGTVAADSGMFELSGLERSGSRGHSRGLRANSIFFLMPAFDKPRVW